MSTFSRAQIEARGCDCCRHRGSLTGFCAAPGAGAGRACRDERANPLGCGHVGRWWEQRGENQDMLLFFGIVGPGLIVGAMLLAAYFMVRA